MENFGRVDLFATKGIEYLFVIGYLILLIVVWNLARPGRLASKVRSAVGDLASGMLRIPQGIFYSRNHTWTHMDESGIARVGLDDFLRHVTGDVLITGLKEPDTQIRKGELLARVDQDGRQLEVFSPISGVIRESNAELSENPGIFREDPYRKGWIYKIKPLDWRKDTGSCLLAEDATRWAANEMERLKEFLVRAPLQKDPSEPAMEILQDGGEIRERVLSGFPGEVWKDFQEEFLKLS